METYLLLIIVILLNIVTIIGTSYYQQKGKNLADKQDIKELTNKVESVKSDFNKDLATLNQRLAKEVNIHKSLSQLEIEASIEWYKDFVILFDFMAELPIQYLGNKKEIRKFYNVYRNKFKSLREKETKSKAILDIFIHDKEKLYTDTIQCFGELMAHQNEFLSSLKLLEYKDSKFSEINTEEKKLIDLFEEKKKISLDYDSKFCLRDNAVFKKRNEVVVELKKNLKKLMNE